MSPTATISNSSVTISNGTRDNYSDASGRGRGRSTAPSATARYGVRHDRHPDRHGADVCQHDRSLQSSVPSWRPALLATLYGALVANLFCLPIADKLHGKLLDEETNRTLIIDGILMIRDFKEPVRWCVKMLFGVPAGKKHRHEEGEPGPGR